MPSLVNNLNTVDALLLATLGLSILIGAMRGLLFELMSLAGWVVAYAVAYLFSPRLLPLLPQDPMAGTAFAGSAMGPGMMPLLAFVLCFVGVLIGWGLLAQLLRLLIRATPLSGFDRLLGSVFGLLRGGLILMALATLVALTPWSRASAWQESVTVHWLHAGLMAVKPLLPPGVARWVAA